MIAIIDYGVGNLRSVEKAFHYNGTDAKISSDKEFIKKADAIVLPGVGAFSDAMKRLENANLIEFIKEIIDTKKPFLGICLGMQLLFDYSEEGQENEKIPGLGILKGSIKRFSNDSNLKVPHMGWNSFIIKNDSLFLQNLPQDPYVYFVHSYYLTAKDRDIVIGTTEYGVEFDVIINKENIFCTQFHPEKSGEI